MKFGNSYIQIGRLELFYTNYCMFGYNPSSCGCFIFHFSFVGFTILSKGCAYDL